MPKLTAAEQRMRQHVAGLIEQEFSQFHFDFDQCLQAADKILAYLWRRGSLRGEIDRSLKILHRKHRRMRRLKRKGRLK